MRQSQLLQRLGVAFLVIWPVIWLYTANSLGIGRNYVQESPLKGFQLLCNDDPPNTFNCEQDVDKKSEPVVSVGIGILLQPNAPCPQDTIAELRKQLPQSKIYVLEEGAQNNYTVLPNYKDPVHFGVCGDYFDVLPYTMGPAACKNLLVRYIQRGNFSHALITDDFHFDPSFTNLTKLIETVNVTGAPFVSGNICNSFSPSICRHPWTLRREGGDGFLIEHDTPFGDYRLPNGCFRAIGAGNFLLGKVSSFLRFHWDGYLQHLEDIDFYLNANYFNVPVWHCPSVRVRVKEEERPVETALSYTDSFYWILGKFNFDSLRKANGGLVVPSEDGWTSTTVYPPFTPLDESRLVSLRPRLLYLFNSHFPSWERGKILHIEKAEQRDWGGTHSLIHVEFKKEFDRAPQYPNVPSVVKLEVALENPQNSIHKHWRIIGEETLKKEMIYYVTTLSTHLENLRRLMNRLEQMESNGEKVHLTIVAFQMNAKELHSVVDKFSFAHHLILLNEKFSRSKGLDEGIKSLRNTTTPSTKVFVIDSSIILPMDFNDRIRESTLCGISIYAPIVRKVTCEFKGDRLDPPKGNPSHLAFAAYGMIGFCVGDYFSSGGYNTSWGTRWGAEDINLVDTFLLHSFLIVRRVEENYFHYNCFRDASQRYYQERNYYHKSLPITPETVLIPSTSEEALRLSLVVQQKMSRIEFMFGQTPREGYYLIRLSSSMLLVRSYGNSYISQWEEVFG